MNKIEMNIDKDGSKFWHLNGELHRHDGPAVEHSDGTKMWFFRGNLHREDGPAVVRDPNSVHFKRYNKLGKLCSWYLNGELHREDGPAEEYSCGTKKWWLYGELHREDGPAVVWSGGGEHWFLHGIELTEEQFNEKKNSWFLNGEELTEEEFKTLSELISDSKKTFQPKQRRTRKK